MTDQEQKEHKVLTEWMSYVRSQDRPNGVLSISPFGSAEPDLEVPVGTYFTSSRPFSSIRREVCRYPSGFSSKFGTRDFRGVLKIPYQLYAPSFEGTIAHINKVGDSLVATISVAGLDRLVSEARSKAEVPDNATKETVQNLKKSSLRGMTKAFSYIDDFGFFAHDEAPLYPCGWQAGFPIFKVRAEWFKVELGTFSKFRVQEASYLSLMKKKLVGTSLTFRALQNEDSVNKPSTTKEPDNDITTTD